MEEYLNVLNEQQREAVVHEGSPLLILAGAGSGKTRVITTKIAYLISQKGVDPWSILSVTFTKKAANEMRERAVAIDERARECMIRTFHSFGSWFLRRYAEVAGLDENFTVYDDDDMATIIKGIDGHLQKNATRQIAKFISLCKDYFLTPDDDLTMIQQDFSVSREVDLKQFYKKYQEQLRATGNVDFGDLIMLPVIIMDEYKQIADYIHNRFKVIMVDEYQDSNIAQYKLLQCLSGVKEGNNCYVCVVGDDDQSIYHFRGAEVENILTFQDKFPNTQIIRLERNYRSTSQILDLAGMVVSKNRNRLGKTLVADRGEGGKPVLAFLPDQMAEATFVADLISKSVLDGSLYRDWAILYRTNAQSLAFEKEFIRRKIPYEIVGSLKFYEREEIKDALAYLSLCSNKRDIINFKRIINKPTRGIGEKTQDKIISEAFYVKDDGGPGYKNLVAVTDNIKDSLPKKAREGATEFVKLFENLKNSFDDSENLSFFMKKLIEDSGLVDFHKEGDKIEGTTRVANLMELVNEARHYTCNMQGITDFLDSISLYRTLDLENENQGEEPVTLITLHNTKGLEYNQVVITGLEEGIFPHMGKAGEELEEERRLFYVGITRARDELYLTSVRRRFMYGNVQIMPPSTFLKEGIGGFSIIGDIPYGFYPENNNYKTEKKKVPYTGPAFGKQIPNPVREEQNGVLSSLSKKYKVGTKIHNDEFGTGYITKSKMRDDNLVITVTYEDGSQKVYLPQFQANKLDIIKD